MGLVLRGHVRLCLLPCRQAVTYISASGITFIIWTCVFFRSIPFFIDGLLFTEEYLTGDAGITPETPALEITKFAAGELQFRDWVAHRLTTNETWSRRGSMLHSKL